jgi:hypothetical protein
MRPAMQHTVDALEAIAEAPRLEGAAATPTAGWVHAPGGVSTTLDDPGPTRPTAGHYHRGRRVGTPARIRRPGGKR